MLPDNRSDDNRSDMRKETSYCACLGYALWAAILLFCCFPILSQGYDVQTSWSTFSSSSPMRIFDQSDYNVTLSSSSPASLDSHVKFTANVSHAKGSQHNFIYVWTVVDKEVFPKRQNSNDYTVLYKTFTEELFDPGSYKMVVNVFTIGINTPGNNESRVATGNLTFYLGGNLNCDIQAHQEIDLQMHPTIFSTEKAIHFSAIVRDNFTDPAVYYSWDISGPAAIKPIVNSSQPQIDIKEEKVGKYALDLNTTAEYNVTVKGSETRRERQGNFTYIFELKDPVTVVNTSVGGEEKITVWTPINMTVACDGCPPFVIHWNINSSELNTTEGTTGITSGPCAMELNRNFSSPGNYTFTVRVVNDVGSVTTKLEFTVSPEEPLVPPVPAYIPVICVLIGLSVIISILVIYHKEQKQASGENRPETANFDFLSHSSTTSWDETRVHVLSAFHKLRQSAASLCSAIKAQFLPEQPSSSTRHPTQHRSYGSYNTTPINDML